MARAEYTCRCKAYKFPHRFGSGKCNGYHLASDHWFTFFGWDKTCQNCPSMVIDEIAGPLCEVVNGGNHPKHCEIVIEFKYDKGIK